jgi:hypothetical protein
MKLIDVTKAFASDEQCLAYLEASRWPDGVRCPTCGAKESAPVHSIGFFGKGFIRLTERRANLFLATEPRMKYVSDFPKVQ